MDKTYLFVKNKLESFGYLPMWIILLIDLIIISITIVITNFLFLNIKLTPYDTLSFYELNGLIIGTNCFFFLLFKTYKGIIRYSSFVDGMKLLFATFSTLVALVSLNYWHYWVFDKKIFIIPGLLIGFVLSLSLLFSFRIFIKYVFEKLLYFDDANNNSKPAMILGSDANAIAVANAIKAENPLRFKVIGFVDKSKSSKSKSILGLPLFYTNKKMSVILRSLKASTLIIVEKALTENERLNIVDDCLENNIKVFTVPLVVNWESQFEISEKIKSFQIEDLLERQAIVIENSVISKQISFKTILITGAAGSIGSEIVRQVLQFKPKALILVDQAETPLHYLSLELEKLELKVNVFSVISDVRNKNGMEKIFKKYNPEIVFHAAAYKHVPLMETNPHQAVLTNVLGTKNLADLSIQYKVHKFVMISTDKAVNPSNIMGASKRIAEKYIQSIHYKNNNKDGFSTGFITTRFGNVLGSNGSVVPLFKSQIQSGGPITITHPDVIRYFMTISEACQLVLEAGAMGNGGEIYLFDMGKPVKIFDLAKKMIKLAGFVPYKDIDIKIVGLRPGEKLYEELLNDDSKTLKTYNKKISISQEDNEDFNNVLKSVNDLIQLSIENDELNLVKQMKQIVPQFKSLNSTFESLD